MAKVLVAIAWPYASGPRHIGHAAATFIPADIFARYHRMKGDDVLVVGGSDMHGTPITVQADREGVPPSVIAERYHALHEKNIEQLGVKYDLYWNTADPNHKKWVQEIFLRLKERGYIYEATMTSPYCPTDQRFLPDRYVEGTCPHCGFTAARGDQCENCGKLLDPFEMKDPKCRICGTTPVPRETKHFFLKLIAFQERLERWLATGKDHWRTHVFTFARSFLAEGLKDRPFTRDLEWGIEVPVPGYETKRIYVWYEAVMGYLTATREWARRQGHEEGWRDWWYDPAAHHYYFIGKDNIVFHAIIWPAMLLAHDEKLTLPHDVPATQFLNISGERMSAGRGRGAWLPDMLERFSADQIRYYATSTMPETKDTEFSWQDFAQRNNAELLAVYGNFVHRALTFAAKNFGSTVSAAGLLDGADKTMIRNIEEQWRKVGQNLEFLHLRDALREAIQLARFGNQYFDQKAPWDLIRRDRVACGTAIHVALRVSRALALLMAPFTPFSSQSLWHALGYEDDVHAQSWDSVVDDIPADQSLRVGKPLFEKIELEAASEDERFDVRVGQITDVQDHPNADKLYVIQVNLGDETRTLVAGMKANYAKEQMKGKRVAVLCNLEPAKLRGVQSNGMVLAAEDEHDVGLLISPEDAPLGAQVLGVRGAPRLTFSEFQRHKIRVAEGGTVTFHGAEGTRAVPLRVGDAPVRVDKPFPPGTPVR